LLIANSSVAHELRPAIANLDLFKNNNILNANLSINLNLEAIIAGINPEHSNSDQSENSEEYQKLRSLDPDKLLLKFKDKFPNFENEINIKSETKNIQIITKKIDIPSIGNLNSIRDTKIFFTINNLNQNELFKFKWNDKFGSIILRVNSIDNEAIYTKFIDFGSEGEWFSLIENKSISLLSKFNYYLILGFKHIIPKGLDHILFIIGLFLLSAKIKNLFWQVTSFTFAHSLTLILGGLKIIIIPSYIVEPIIALSISYIAIENIFVQNLSKLRPYIIFIFGLLHGLGFAGILNELEVLKDSFVISLLAFNIGIELGQILVLVLCYFLIAFLFKEKKWYRKLITKPISAIIALIGIFWFFQRLLGF